MRREDGVFHFSFYLFGELIDASLCFVECGFRAEEMELYLGGAREDGGFDVRVLFVDRRGAGIDVGLGDEGHAKHAACEMTGWQGSGKKRLNLIVEERFQLFRRAGKEDNNLSDGFVGGTWNRGVEILSGSAAIFVFEDGGAVEDVCLFRIVRRHDHLACSEAFVEGGESRVVHMDADVESCGDSFAREIVFSGAETAGEENDIGAFDGNSRCASEMDEAVTNDGFEGDLNAQVVEAAGQVKRVGVLAVGSEHLGANCDDFSDHGMW